MKRFNKGDRVLLVDYHTTDRGLVQFRARPALVRSWGERKGTLVVGDRCSGIGFPVPRSVDLELPAWPKVVATVAELEALAAAHGPRIAHWHIESRKACVRSIVDFTTVEAVRAKYAAELAELEAAEPVVRVEVMEGGAS